MAHFIGEVQPQLRPSAGARINYRDLVANGQVLQPPPEIFRPDHHNVTLHRACTCTRTSSDRFRLHPYSDTMMMASHSTQVGSTFLVREVGATQAYAQYGKAPVTFGEHRHPEWGRLNFAIVCPAIGNNVFQAPHPKNAQHVAIKQLNKRVVHYYLQLGGEENPYREMARMEELGDNIHVLRHIELLEDDDFLYMVFPKACEDGTLKDTIRWFDSDNIMETRRSRTIFRKILQILGYLEERGINHHDLSPDNFLFLTPDNLVVFDLALSVRIPVHHVLGHRTLIAPQGNFGTYAWMDPIVYANQEAYDGVAMDLWGAAVILYNLLTNQILYEQPSKIDISFRYFILAGGLSSTPLNERAVDLLYSLSYEAQFDERYVRMHQTLLEKATVHLTLSPEAIEILENLLNANPANRYSLALAMESTYVQSTED